MKSTSLVFLVSLFFIGKVNAQAVEWIGSENCFKGPFASHSEFKNMLLTKNSKTEQQKSKFEQFFSENFPASLFEQRQQQLDCHSFLYRVADVHVRGYLVKPKHVAGKLPVIIYNLGGNRQFSSIVFGGQLWHKLMPLAEQGYVVLASQYRGGATLLPEYKTAPDEFGGADVDDVIALLDLAEQIPEADTTRIGMCGWSRGAMMTFMAARRDTRIKAVVVGGGVADSLRDLERRPEMENVYHALIPNYLEQKEEQLRKRSPVHWLQELSPNLQILVLHGQNDDRVDVNNAFQLGMKLQELKRPYRLVIYPNGSHGLNEYQEQVLEEVSSWFKRYLGDNTVVAMKEASTPE